MLHEATKSERMFTADALSVECSDIRGRLPELVLIGDQRELNEDVAFHLSHCRNCLKAYIALQAAADLARG